MGKIRISQTMIVKNEEQNIERALSWGKDFLYEQIVVDTGSTDRTVELAEKMGATVCHFDWIDDFAAAKNYAISKCTGDWIALLDADEYFAPEDAAKVQSLVEKADGDGKNSIFSAWVNLRDDGSIATMASQIRLFKNLPGLQYYRRIHEQLRYPEGGLAIADATKELAILHTGYQSQAAGEKKRSNRNLNLLLQEIQEHPGDGEIMGYLGDEYFGREDYKTAEEYYKKAVEIERNRQVEMNLRLSYDLFRLILIAFHMNQDPEDAVRIHDDAICLFPQEADFAYILAINYFDAGDYANAAKYYEEMLQKLEQFGTQNQSMNAAADLVQSYEKYAHCLYQTGRLNEAVRTASLVLQADHTAYLALKTYLLSFKKAEETGELPVEQIAGALGRILDFSSPKERLLICRAAADTGYTKMEKYIRSIMTDAELTVADKMS